MFGEAHALARLFRDAVNRFRLQFVGMTTSPRLTIAVAARDSAVESMALDALTFVST